MNQALCSKKKHDVTRIWITHFKAHLSVTGVNIMILNIEFNLLSFRYMCIAFLVHILKVNIVYGHVRQQFINFSCQNLNHQTMYEVEFLRFHRRQLPLHATNYTVGIVTYIYIYIYIYIYYGVYAERTRKVEKLINTITGRIYDLD
jgi:uncharacterized membrane protein